jgi:hypothetical protein
MRIEDTELWASDGPATREVIRGEHLVDASYFRAIAKIALG